ncbi:MAG: glycoside hydrolase family 15 protein [Lysobacterales bacterium]
MNSEASKWPDDDAPGAPGIGPTWTSSAKDIVGTSLEDSRIWFTLGFGIVNEVYYPRVDLPQIRDLGFIVADDAGFWVEIKRLKDYMLELPQAGIPAPTVVHRHERFTLTLRITPDAHRDVLLIDVSLDGDPTLKPYVLLAPHIGGTGQNNVAAVGQHYSRKVLWAEQGPFGLALAAVNRSQADAFGRLSAGYVGNSDGWQDFNRNGVMSWNYLRAGPGNVAMMGELERESVLALGFGSSRGAAASLAVAALAQPFENAWTRQVSTWKNWHRNCHAATEVKPVTPEIDAQWATSRMVLRCHMDKTQQGGLVASLSIPWGNSSDSRGGYHLVWPRDLVECATALLGAGSESEARDVLRYLLATQYEDGHWNQNQWLGGTPFWHGIQLDETALPVVLAALLHEKDALGGIEVADMVRRALGFIARMGPVSDQDRWEEDRGINTFTIAAMIAALVAGARFLNPGEQAAALDLADDWNARIESWLYTQNSTLARQTGVAGHYIRIAPARILQDPSAADTIVPLRNRNPDPGISAKEQVANDFLQLVRFGLRAPDAAPVRDTLAVVDATLRVNTPPGPAWYRYNGDGYGEHEDGSAYDGTGVGRLWPLLSGERGHYELIAGNDPKPFLQAMCAMTGPSGMLPEQVWDTVTDKGSSSDAGRPTGSAMPLAWAHAEFIKLLVSSQLARAFDCPQSVADRYGGRIPVPKTSVWSENSPVRTFFTGSDLRINLRTSANVRWRTSPDSEWHEQAAECGLPGVYSTILPTRSLVAGDAVVFSWQVSPDANWSENRELVADSA